MASNINIINNINGNNISYNEISMKISKYQPSISQRNINVAIMTNGENIVMANNNGENNGSLEA